MRYLDYWGSVVHAFDLQQPHREMEVIGRSVVETSVPPSPPDQLSWAELACDDVRDEFAEFLAPTRQVPLDPRVLDVASRPCRPATPPTAAGLAVVGWVHDQFTYVRRNDRRPHLGDRGVGRRSRACARTSPIWPWPWSGPWASRRRYCSGYLHPDPDAGIGPTARRSRATPGSRSGPATGRALTRQTVAHRRSARPGRPRAQLRGRVAHQRHLPRGPHVAPPRLGGPDPARLTCRAPHRSPIHRSPIYRSPALIAHTCRPVAPFMLFHHKPVWVLGATAIPWHGCVPQRAPPAPRIGTAPRRWGAEVLEEPLHGRHQLSPSTWTPPKHGKLAAHDAQLNMGLAG